MKFLSVPNRYLEPNQLHIASTQAPPNCAFFILHVVSERNLVSLQDEEDTFVPGR